MLLSSCVTIAYKSWKAGLRSAEKFNPSEYTRKLFTMFRNCPSVLFLYLAAMLAVQSNCTPSPALVREATPLRSTSKPAPVKSVYLKSTITYLALSAVTGSALMILKSW